MERGEMITKLTRISELVTPLLKDFPGDPEAKPKEFQDFIKKNCPKAVRLLRKLSKEELEREGFSGVTKLYWRLLGD